MSEGAIIREVMTAGRQAINRALSVIDAFRPKVLIKKPLTEALPIAHSEAIIGAEIGGIMDRIMSRIEELRSATRMVTGQAPESEHEAHAMEIVEKEKGRPGVLY